MKTGLCLLRSTVFYIGYALAVVVFGLSLLIVIPWLPLRHRIRVAAGFNRFVICWSRWVCGIRYRVEGLHAMPEGPCIIVSNHQSAWETYLFALLFSPQAAVLKRELLLIPFFGWVLRLLKPIAIDRGKPTRALKQLLQQGEARLNEGFWITIFPEGTRVLPGQVRRFNKGAAMLAVRTGVPIVPVAHNSGICWPAGQVSKAPGEIVVVVGAPMSSADTTVDALHERVELWIRQQMVDLVQVPSTAATGPDAAKRRLGAGSQV
ncbi:lysophospholipid acyltransferase family protein [Mangrovitalea sediminis]|uniref:lysophospholipid acyltransferase family protein n=1 Tax=Mangrovitalea sediminis TaxID=1982043 RepID=UPI0018E922E8|nr:lysophospholipid acyltransferase family protein [Mangrovitalea sediminis]